MRTFKFRAWYKPHLEKGIVQKFIQKEIDGKLYFVAEDDDEVRYEFYIPFIDDDWIIEPHVGLKDKNNVEIYEGDILKFYGKYNGKIVYRIGSFFFEEKTGRHTPLCMFNPIDSEVVGNIHDKEKMV